MPSRAILIPEKVARLFNVAWVQIKNRQVDRWHRNAFAAKSRQSDIFFSPVAVAVYIVRFQQTPFGFYVVAGALHQIAHQQTWIDNNVWPITVFASLSELVDKMLSLSVSPSRIMHHGAAIHSVGFPSCAQLVIALSIINNMNDLARMAQ